MLLAMVSAVLQIELCKLSRGAWGKRSCRHLADKLRDNIACSITNNSTHRSISYSNIQVYGTFLMLSSACLAIDGIEASCMILHHTLRHPHSSNPFMQSFQLQSTLHALNDMSRERKKVNEKEKERPEESEKKKGEREKIRKEKRANQETRVQAEESARKG